jgi:hypothetical protein
MDFFDRTFFFFGYILTVNTSSHVPVLNFEREKLCTPKCNHNMNWYFFRTCVLCFFHLSLVKTIVKSAKYPVNNMPSLWKTITLFHKDEVPEIIKLAQYALTLPLYTCSCERVFSNQNLIVTRLRFRLNPKISDKTFKSRNTRQGNNQAWLPKLFKQMKGSKEQTLEKKDFYYSVDSLLKCLFICSSKLFLLLVKPKHPN